MKKLKLCHSVCFVTFSWDDNPECTDSRAPFSEPGAKNGLVVITKEANGTHLILKISVSNGSYLGRKGVASFPSTAANSPEQIQS